jgi:hypothetical protein
MLLPTVVRRGAMLLGLLTLSGILLGGSTGCLKIGGDEPLVRVNAPGPEPAPVDTSRVPPISSVEEGRQQLGVAYQRIDYLERELSKSQRDKEKLKADNKTLKKERDTYKDQVKKLTGH